MLSKKFLAPLFLIFIGCSNTNLIPFESDNTCEPSFFKHYVAKNNEIVGIGIAPPNINGLDAQKKSAIAKALNEIAAQKGVNVKSIYVSQKGVVNNSLAYSKADSASIHKINNRVNARVVKECLGPDGYYYVLMKAY